MSSAPTAKHASWAYAEQHGGQDPVFEAARLRAAELGVDTIGEGTTSALIALAAASRAQSIVEVGTGVGASSAALLRGAREAVLTTIDMNPDHSAAARDLLRQEGISPSRTRLITGRAEQVLPRLKTQGYDMVFVDTDPTSAAEFAYEAVRLLRTGGMLLINDALHGDRVPRPAVRDAGTHALRTLERALLEDERVTTALFGTGTGLLLAVRT